MLKLQLPEFTITTLSVTLECTAVFSILEGVRFQNELT